MQQDPEAGDLWRHRNGNMYRVLMLANRPNEERYPTTVVYETVANGNLWTRPLSDWHRSFTFAGRPYDGGS